MRSEVRRKTEETSVEVEIDLDGSGNAKVQTGIDFLDHMLESFAKHGRFDLKLDAEGDLKHHIAEDAMLMLGNSIRKALGEAELEPGMRRIGHALVPMDDALVLVAVDLSGRPYFDMEGEFKGRRIEDMNMDSGIFAHILERFSHGVRMNLHVQFIKGKSDHHKAEASFKGLGIALSEALMPRSDP